MGPVSNVNQLYGDHQALAMLQRRARASSTPA